MMTPKQLRAKYSYQFNGRNIGFGFYKGWFSILVKACEDIDQLLGAEKYGFHWVQIKEKFGTVRMYWEWDRKAANEFPKESSINLRYQQVLAPHNKHDDAAHLSDQLHAIVEAAETHTYHVCMVCGEPGKQVSFSGFIQTLCPEHARMKSAGKLPPAWFAEEEDTDASR